MAKYVVLMAIYPSEYISKICCLLPTIIDLRFCFQVAQKLLPMHTYRLCYPMFIEAGTPPEHAASSKVVWRIERQAGGAHPIPQSSLPVPKDIYRPGYKCSSSHSIHQINQSSKPPIEPIKSIFLPC